MRKKLLVIDINLHQNHIWIFCSWLTDHELRVGFTSYINNIRFIGEIYADHLLWSRDHEIKRKIMNLQKI